MFLLRADLHIANLFLSLLHIAPPRLSALFSLNVESIIDNFDSREIPSSVYTDFHSFPRKKRNACFDIYWKLRQQYILEELSEDNELLLDPTEEDAFNKMVEDERRSVQNYELMLELPEFAEKEGARAADVLQMGKYFLEYVKVMHCKDEQPETIRKRDNTKGQSF